MEQCLEPSEHILVVSGLPRSGTSLMMQMLAAGGVEPFTDGVRTADVMNPRGYLEHEAVKGLMHDDHFLDEVGDRAVKVIAQLLFHLPDRFSYQVIFMERPMNEVLESQRRLLDHQGYEWRAGAAEELAGSFAQTRDLVTQILPQLPIIELLVVSYHEVLTAPREQASRVAELLGRKLAVGRMAAVVDTTLYRVRHERGGSGAGDGE